MTEMKESAFALLNTWTTCDTSLVAADMAPGFIEYDRPQPTAEGLAGLNEKLGLFHKAHKDVTIKVLKQIAADNIVCTEWLLISTVRTPEARQDRRRRKARGCGGIHAHREQRSGSRRNR